MSNNNDNESWDKYQKLILKELKSLRYSNERMNDELITFQRELADLQSTKSFVDELKKSATLEQYRDLYKDVTILQKFKDKATTAMIIIQFLFGFAMWYLNFKK